jgi:division protein CdvB (Snf7/Vps24/ESCRT-III family)
MENNNIQFSSEAKDTMRDAVALAEEIATCDRLIESPEVPEEVKEQMRIKRVKLVEEIGGLNSSVLRNIEYHNTKN